MPITGNVKFLPPGTHLTPFEALVYQSAREIIAVAESANLSPNLTASAILTALVKFAGGLEPNQRDKMPTVLRNVARMLEDHWATRQ